MGKKEATPRRTKKHLARAQREQIQRRWIMGGTIGIAILVISVVGYGWASINLTPVATVDGEKISSAEFQGRVRLAYAELINQAMYSQQFEQLATQLADSEGVGKRVLDQMVDDILIRNEANQRGIQIGDEEIERGIEQAFGYFSEGTPTPIPTFTPDPTELALETITPTSTEGPSPTPSPTFTPGPSPTPTATPMPQPTATVYTREAYLENRQTTLNRLNTNYGISEEDFTNQFASQIYRQKLLAEFETETAQEQEHVQARHILVEDEATAAEVLAQLDEGEAWVEMANKYSTDESNKENGGDLGWFPRGRMDPAFEAAAFGGEIGEIVGPVESSFGWHLIEILDRDMRGVDEYFYQIQVQQAFLEWLNVAREEAEIDISSNWAARVPPPPDLSQFSGP